jgi:hypothetical protein
VLSVIYAFYFQFAVDCLISALMNSLLASDSLKAEPKFLALKPHPVIQV